MTERSSQNPLANSHGPYSQRQQATHCQQSFRRVVNSATANGMPKNQTVVSYQSQPQFNSNQMNIQIPYHNGNSIAILQQQPHAHQFVLKNHRNGAPHTTPNVKILTTRNPQYNQQQIRPLDIQEQSHPNHLNQNSQLQNTQESQQNTLEGSRSSSNPVLIQYNIRNGLYIRPNSPTNQQNNVMNSNTAYNQRMGSRNQVNHYNNPISNPHHRLNNTAVSNIGFEEEKLDPTPTPLEEYKQALNAIEYRTRSFYNINQPVPTEEDQDQPDIIQSQSANYSQQNNENLGEERFVPPPTTNIYSPPNRNTPPNENSALYNQQLPQHSQFNSAPLLSPNQSDIWNIAHNLTAATTNTVGSTGLGTGQINMTPSDLRSRHYIFQGENINQQVIYLQRPPPPSPLKLEENGAQSELSISQPQIIYINECRENLQEQHSQMSMSQSFNDHQNSSGRQSMMSSVYQEVLSNQQKSNQTTLKGLEIVLEENERMKARMQLLENEIYRLQAKNTQYQRIIHEHIINCPNVIAQDLNQSPLQSQNQPNI